MYKLCKTEQSAQRQRQLEEGLLEAMIIQRYEDISVSDLCDQMGVPRKSFYRYFTSKDGALHALIDHRFLDFEMQSSYTASGNVLSKAHLVWFYEYWKSQRKLLDALTRSGLSSQLAERALFLSVDSQMFDIEVRRMPKSFAQIAETFVIAGLMSLVLQWYLDGFRESAADMAEMTRMLLTRPLVTE